MNCKRSTFCLLLMTFSLATGSYLFDKMVDYSETDGENKRNINIRSALSRNFKRSEWLSDDEYVKIDFLFVVDSTVTEIFKNNSENMGVFLCKTMNKVQEMFDSLELEIKVAMNGIIKITEENQAELAPFLSYVAPPSHLNQTNAGWLLAEVARFYSKSTNELVVDADVVIFVTRRRLVRFHKDGTFRPSTGGVAFVNEVCNNWYKYAAVEYSETLQNGVVQFSSLVLGCRLYTSDNYSCGRGNKLLGFHACCKRDLENMIKNRKSCVIEKYSENQIS